ncbi:alpha/beta fold hydrolase [Spirosoma sp. KUDC1026]|uniref:alpha/beta fold hydrolase n=1 Tax=Spirosoma sp. KUDC1026 TaxID=2745947 RepID=UPI00159BEFA2|nr:alpha/beta hydrolase [Spirosoma sp. KUDC1026]QKZ11656.1 alpha/beta hydrolase [Spirosoma sp. KUDC1026]
MTGADAVYYFSFGHYRIAYRIFGNGPASLLAFHGFGQTSRVYWSLQKAVGNRYTVYAFDLPHHGNSQSSIDQLLTKTDWERLVSDFLRAHSIKQFALMGFSLGGRFALITAELFSDWITDLYLIAPDGIVRNHWYDLATRSAIGRSLFCYVLRHLSVLTNLGHGLTRMGLLNRTFMRFVEHSISTPGQRQLVYQVWTQTRLIWPAIDELGAALAKRTVPVWIFLGAFDRIIPGYYVRPLFRLLTTYQLTIFRSGHNRLIELTAGELAKRPAHYLPQPGNGHND